MNNKRQSIAFLYLEILVSPFLSVFSHAKCIWGRGRREISYVETPPGFKVSPQEVHGLVEPLQKFSWFIYADKQYYYVSQLNNLIPIYGVCINSYLAKKYGFRLSGMSRSEYEFIRKEIGDGGTRDIYVLSKILEKHNQSLKQPLMRPELKRYVNEGND